jgi:hypothetical protein
MIEFVFFLLSNTDKNNDKEKAYFLSIAISSLRRRCLKQKYLDFAVNDRKRREKKSSTQLRVTYVFFFFPFFSSQSFISNTKRSKKEPVDVFYQLDVVACSGCNCCKRVSIRRRGSFISIDNQQDVDVISR